MNDKRIFFRFDVRVRYFMEPFSESSPCMHIDRKALISDHDYQLIDKETAALKNLFEDDRHKDNGAVELFYRLEQKLNFMVYLLEAVLGGEDVRNSEQLTAWLRINQDISAPESRSESAVIELLQAFYQRVDEYINELLWVIEHSVQGKVFMYSVAVPKRFKAEDFLTGINVQAKQGNWMAKVITLLVVKLNHYERLLKRLKEAYQQLSDSRHWPLEQLSLGAGGFSIIAQEQVAINSQYCLLLDLDDDFVFAKAHCVYSEPVSEGSVENRIAFEFDEISSEHRAHIVRFLTQKELEEHDDQVQQTTE